MADYLVICSGNSTPQLDAINRAIEEELVKYGVKPRREGPKGSGWLILDFGSVIVHILGEKERNFFKLEDLWGKKSIIYHV